jgi:hypothetical protein
MGFCMGAAKAGVKECLKEWATHNNKPVGN